MGVCSVFVFAELLGGWRYVHTGEYRAKVDWVYGVKELFTVYFSDVSKVRLVCGNLNTYNLSSLYEVFPAVEACELARRLVIHYAPEYGGWFNVVGIEFSVFSWQCLGRRVDGLGVLNVELSVCEADRNDLQKCVDWQFTTKDARIKLKKLYPIICNN